MGSQAKKASINLGGEALGVVTISFIHIPSLLRSLVSILVMDYGVRSYLLNCISWLDTSGGAMIIEFH